MWFFQNKQYRHCIFRATLNNMKVQNSLTNHFLIAMPALRDLNFYRAVTYICEHNENGAVGIIINRPLEIKLEVALQQMHIEIKNEKFKDAHLLFGGPIQQERGFVIHRPHGQWRSSLKTSPEIAITTSQDILEAIAAGNGPEDAIIALGYAAWASNQLEQEMLNNSWLSCPADAEILFKVPQEDRWIMAVTKLGININHLSYQVGHA